MDMKAQRRALGIPDILLIIFHQMDPRTLLISQRVCKQWSEIIKTTTRLQQALFFEPEKQPEGDHEQASRYCNPILSRFFPSFFPGGKMSVDGFRAVHLADLAMPDPQKLKSFLREDASWRRMLTQQPPVYSVGSYRVKIVGDEQNWIPERQNRVGQGLRMGTVFNWFIGEGEDGWKRSRFGIILGGPGHDNMFMLLHLKGTRLDFEIDAFGELLHMHDATDLILFAIEHDVPESDTKGPLIDPLIYEEDLRVLGDIEQIQEPMQLLNRGFETLDLEPWTSFPQGFTIDPSLGVQDD